MSGAKQHPELDADIIIYIAMPAVAAHSRPHSPAQPGGMIEAKLLNANDTAFLLQYALGPLRAWTHFLADMRRSRSSIGGHRLLPACVQADGHEEHPLYLVSDIRGFVRAVRGLGMSRAHSRVRVIEGAIDLSEPNWSKRRLQRQRTNQAN